MGAPFTSTNATSKPSLGEYDCMMTLLSFVVRYKYMQTTLMTVSISNTSLVNKV